MEVSNRILSDITVYMKYAKFIPGLNRRETWEELVTRNKNMHIKKYPQLDFICGAVKKDNRLYAGLRVKDIKRQFNIIPSSVVSFFIKLKSLKKVGKFNTKYKCSADYDFYYRAIITNKLKGISTNKKALILIKSTVPVGYTESLRQKFQIQHIIFSPEFLREGQALYDCLYPSRIIISNKEDEGKRLAKLFMEGAIKKDIPVLYTDSTEAEAIKLFSNTYLAMRVTFFNELDTFAVKHELSTKQIIDGISLDPRIGDHYNNPSFGYGGYCLPKDTKQLLANYKDIPNNIMQAIVHSNETRKEFLVEEIINTKAKVVGIYRLIMKSNSDNYRESAILGIIERLKEKNIEILIYEPQINQDRLEGLVIVKELKEFMSKSEIIIANRYHPELEKVKDKVYSRDISNKD